MVTREPRGRREREWPGGAGERVSGADRAPAAASTEGAGAPADTPIPVLIPSVIYELDGVRMKYIGQGVYSKDRWFTLEDGHRTGKYMPDALAMELLGSGMLKPCP